jgi:predicted AlkP superfamily pyrophosphatase or phosphodiesterase
MKKLLLLLTMTMCWAAQLQAQTRFNERPKLVVGIVVDQMRWDYLGRYYDQFQDDGFKRLINKGYSCNNCLINYLPTITAIGHTSIYTGSTPAFHGICGNTFYINGVKRSSCEDPNVMPVGTNNEKKGKSSPVNLLASTIGDQLRLHTDFQSKVIGVSYKDRASALPAGRSANAAYWIDTDNRQFITSTWYMQELPQWAKDFNAQMKKNKELQKVGKDVGLYPLCGHLIADMSISALKGEQLGKGKETDMLCISFSQTDIIGHEWATRGQHTDEAYLELDKDIARLLKAFDEQVGEGNYLVFLTADHGGAHNFQFMEDHKLNGGAWKWDEVYVKEAAKQLTEKFGLTKNIIKDCLDYRVVLDKEAIREQGLDEQAIRDAIVEEIQKLPHVSFAFDFKKAATAPVPEFLKERALKGYHHDRSGDIIFMLEPGWYGFGKYSSPVGTTHGEWNPYDAHIPLLFYGWKVEHGATSREVHITDIAPTVCQKLHIQQPNACVGEPITEIIDD